MKAPVRFACSGILVALLLASAAGLCAAEPGDRPLSVESAIEEVIPLELRTMLLERPHVRFLVTVDADGVVVDYIATHATHFKLLERAEKRLMRAKFSPAIFEGAPVLATGEFLVTFFDPEQRAVRSGLISQPYGSPSIDAAVRRMSEADKKSLEYSASQREELDHPLEMTAGKVLVMTDAEGQPAEGACVVEFFINNRGEVRLPRIVSSDNETVSKSALLTLFEIRFSPVTRRGRPTYVKVRQPMEFHRGIAPDSGA